MSDSPPTQGPSPEAFVQAQVSQDFVELRSRFRRFAFPMTAAFLIWYVLYVLLSTYASAWMSVPVFGNVNRGLLISLGQFVTTFLLTYLYVRHANKDLDPLAEKVRNDLEVQAN